MRGMVDSDYSVEILFIHKFMSPELDLSNHFVKVILTESWVYNNSVFSQGNYFQSSSEYVQVYRIYLGE